jgi:hypothetical protein
VGSTGKAREEAISVLSIPELFTFTPAIQNLAPNISPQLIPRVVTAYRPLTAIFETPRFGCGHCLTAIMVDRDRTVAPIPFKRFDIRMDSRSHGVT